MAKGKKLYIWFGDGKVVAALADNYAEARILAEYELTANDTWNERRSTKRFFENAIYDSYSDSVAVVIEAEACLP